LGRDLANIEENLNKDQVKAPSMRKGNMNEGTGKPILEMVGISKIFGGVHALRGVDFDLIEGEIHGLVGENGAGKSTIMKIIAGVHFKFDGEMRLDGKPVQFSSAHDALKAGIGMVHQELSIVPDLTVAENVFLGVQPTYLGVINWSQMKTQARQQLASLGLDIDPNLPMSSLPVGLQQLVELSRVLFSGAKIIILDEPTSALSPPEIQRLFQTLRHLKSQGKTIVFISHFLDDVLEISDRITVFRSGEKIITKSVAHFDKAQIIAHMIGRDSTRMHMGEVANLTSQDHGEVILKAQNLSDGKMIKNISLELRAGEIMGVYGFMGSGQIELARALFGKIKLLSGPLLMQGKPLHLRSTSSARAAGIAFVPESRGQMLFRNEPIFKNISLPILHHIHALFLKSERERAIARDHIKDMQIRPPHTDVALGNLSGGNQQKVALAKWLTHLPKILILSEPTRGMDVGAKEDVIKIVKKIRNQGVAVLILSSEPETILAFSDRIAVLKRGIVAREFSHGSVTKEDLLDAA